MGSQITQTKEKKSMGIVSMHYTNAKTAGHSYTTCQALVYTDMSLCQWLRNVNSR